jgi:hypothetical protein
MSAAESADEHDEGELHQAGWVYFTTYIVCLSFLALLMFAKGMFLVAATIVWFSLVSIPIQIHLAKREWMLIAIWLFAAPIGYYLLQFLFSMVG